jgi:RsiW-degrading membrane proteinase PrsW (M82 family)
VVTVFNLILAFFLPFIWVIYLFKKDPHPEPFFWLFIAFFLGIISAFLSLYSQKLLEDYFFKEINNWYYFLAALIEEFLKFILIRIFIIPRKVFDEPIDAMIYMIFVAFGFAFIENIGVILKFDKNILFIILFLRFLGANLLHILTSSLIGFGYSLSLNLRNFLVFTIFFLTATFLHFLYNLFILNLEFGILQITPILWFFFFVVIYQLNYLSFKKWKMTKSKQLEL